ncbi:MAG: hypothetical protein JW997_06170, partial [Actinobacteria bacterium]|nr:hypothetical protein [Actinomycetota bacterium]
MNIENKEFNLWDNNQKKIFTITAKKVGSGWKAICPMHNDHIPSLSINAEEGIYHCLSCGFKGKLYNPDYQKRGKKIVYTYDYMDENKKLVYQCVRYEPKSFAFRRLDKNGKWVYDLKATKKILYKLPELVSSDIKTPVFIVEGEKDANNLSALGFIATTSPMGAGKWNPDYSKYFKDRTVILIADNDEEGRKHIQSIADNLADISKSIKLIILPGLKEKEDISDWIKKGGTREKLLELIDNSSEYINLAIGDNFDVRLYSEYVIKKYDIGSDESKRIWLYDEKKGIWIVDAESDLRSILRKGILKREHLKKYYVTEVIEDIRDRTFKSYSFNEPDPYLIPFKDKIYDLKTDKLLDYRPEYYFINKLNVNIDTKNKECPMIEKIFTELVGEANMGILFEITAYCMLRSYPYQKIFFIYGEGRNGKSTFINILTHLLGIENVASIDLNELSVNKFATSQLHGKLAIICGELDMNILSRTGVVKQITGGDRIKSEKKFKEPFYFKNYAKIIVMTNKLPETQDRTDAFYRRVNLTQFPNKFEGKGADMMILDKISKEEYEGYAWKSLEMLRILQERQFVMSNDYSTDELKKIYDRLSSHLAKFLEESTVDEALGEIASDEFNEAFSNYLISQNIPPWS